MGGGRSQGDAQDRGQAQGKDSIVGTGVEDGFARRSATGRPARRREPARAAANGPWPREATTAAAVPRAPRSDTGTRASDGLRPGHEAVVGVDELYLISASDV